MNSSGGVGLGVCCALDVFIGSSFSVIEQIQEGGIKRKTRGQMLQVDG